MSNDCSGRLCDPGANGTGCLNEQSQVFSKTRWVAVELVNNAGEVFAGIKVLDCPGDAASRGYARASGSGVPDLSPNRSGAVSHTACAVVVRATARFITTARAILGTIGRPSEKTASLTRRDCLAVKVAAANPCR